MFLLSGAISSQVIDRDKRPVKTDADIITGAERMNLYLHFLHGKNVAIAANHTALINGTHLVDTLISLGVRITKIFAPEHGFRGEADNGEKVKSGVDKRTGIPLLSLYGDNKKPDSTHLKDVDIIIFDIQDVGARFYTYISTMHYLMQSCMENNKKLIILDRPNPNGFYVDGPVMEEKHKSFVGLHPVPIVHGMTICEYATMILKEGWVDSTRTEMDIEYIPCEDYSHKDLYQLPVKPSPNLPNMKAVYLYPSLCLFEGTVMSVGRGTPFPFQVIGHPKIKKAPFRFKPVPVAGSKNPPYKNQVCFGYDLRDFAESFVLDSGRLKLSWLQGTYEIFPDKKKYFNSFFFRLSGTDNLRKQIEGKVCEEEIRKSWEPHLTNFKNLRKRYLLYEDFE